MCVILPVFSSSCNRTDLPEWVLTVAAITAFVVAIAVFIVSAYHIFIRIRDYRTSDSKTYRDDEIFLHIAGYCICGIPLVVATASVLYAGIAYLFK